MKKTFFCIPKSQEVMKKNQGANVFALGRLDAAAQRCYFCEQGGNGPLFLLCVASLGVAWSYGGYFLKIRETRGGHNKQDTSNNKNLGAKGRTQHTRHKLAKRGHQKNRQGTKSPARKRGRTGEQQSSRAGERASGGGAGEPEGKGAGEQGSRSRGARERRKSVGAGERGNRGAEERESGGAGERESKGTGEQVEVGTGALKKSSFKRKRATRSPPRQPRRKTDARGLGQTGLQFEIADHGRMIASQATYLLAGLLASLLSP